MIFQVSCKSNRWITNTHFKDKLTPVLVFLLSLALPFNFFSLTGGTFVLVQIDEILLSLPIVFILHMLRWYILAKLTSIMARNSTYYRVPYTFITFLDQRKPAFDNFSRTSGKLPAVHEKGNDRRRFSDANDTELPIRLEKDPRNGSL